LSQTPKKQGSFKRGATPVGDLVSRLLNPVIERRAGMTMDMIQSWVEIVGETHAKHSRPEKLNWPRQASDDDPFEPATLVVACEGSHALFFQHDSSAIIERINTYFGFAAVNKLKLHQQPLAPIGNKKPLQAREVSSEKQARLNELLETVDDPELRNALEKMGKGVFSEGS
jgi:hypothetical protein